ncbi:cell wall-binding repeat-containing protein [Clostridium sp. ATCC 25772]|uniref:cell wall-binding repeat-containing protein n=1 Tax=Clostridium sp. ATCC 25772 TaxID=1676991 RepID=UPI000782145D|nr:cell wall-binding repeat-containing protein [Clostridium sp. ATCC 25772]
MNKKYRNTRTINLRRKKREKRKKRKKICATVIAMILIVSLGMISKQIYVKNHSCKILVNNEQTVEEIEQATENLKGKTIRLKGSDIYNKYIEMSKSLKSKNIVLVNGNNMLEKLLAMPLASYKNASVLVIDNDNIPDDVKNEVSRINPEEVYIVGNDTSISKTVESQIDSNKKIKRICGKDICQLSKNIAKEMSGYNTVFVASEQDKDKNTLIASVASKLKAPILFSTKEDVKNNKFITKVEKENRYILNEGLFSKEKFNDESLIDIKDFNNSSIKINNKFFTKSNSIIVLDSKEQEDILASSMLKRPIVFYKDNITEDEKGYLKNSDFKNIYFESKIPNEFLEKTLNIKNNLEPGELKFTKPKAAFFFSHQDDVILFAHSAIMNAVKELGPENVKVVLINRGNGSFVYKRIKSGKLSPKIPSTMTLEEFAKARTNEFDKELDAYGIPDENRTYLDIPDSSTKEHIDELRTDIREFISDGQDYQFFTFSYFKEPQSDHSALGRVFRELYDNQEIDNVYFVNKPKAYEALDKDVKFSTNIKTDEDMQTVRNAMNSYAVYEPENGLYGIGIISVRDMFETLEYNLQNGGYIYGTIPGQKDSN